MLNDSIVAHLFRTSASYSIEIGPVQRSPNRSSVQNTPAPQQTIRLKKSASQVRSTDHAKPTFLFRRTGRIKGDGFGKRASLMKGDGRFGV